MKKLACVLALISLTGLVGCLEYKEEVKLNKDGSGSTQLRLAVSQAYLEQMEEVSRMMAQMSDGESEPPEQPSIVSSKEEIQEFLSKFNSGAKLESYEVSDTDEFRVWNLAFTFTKLAELDLVGASVFQSDEDEDDSLDTEHQPSVSFAKQDGGKWLFTRTAPENAMSGGMGMGDESSEDYYAESDEYADEYEEEEDSEESSALGEELEAYAGEMEKAMGDPNKPAFTFSVTFPGNVVESNASAVDGNTATWSFTMEQLAGPLPTMTASVED